jgi:hypothetical protein
MLKYFKTSLEKFLQSNNLNPSHSAFSIDLVLLLILSVIIIPYVFYNIRNFVRYPVNSNLTLTDYYILIILLVYLVIGAYQQYFWTKSNKIKKETIIEKTGLDHFFNNIFKENDTWIYVYNFIYYIIFGLIIISIRDYKHFAILFLGGIALMTGLSIIWYLYPNKVESRMTPSNYFLKKTQMIDNNENNACPSAHIVFAMYSYYLLRNVIGEGPALLIPILISISCLATTQHVTTDVIFGVIYTMLFYNLILHKTDPSVFK